MLDTTLLRTLLAPFGELRAQPRTDWTAVDALPDALIEFYQQVGPWGPTIYENVGPIGLMIEVGGNPVCIPPLHKLERLQEGYAWSQHPNNKLPGWNSDWIVVAEQGGDPFILDRTTGHVLFAFHGAGGWNPKFFAPDLATAFGALATVARAFKSLDYETHFVDSELTGTGVEIIESALSKFLGGNASADQMLSTWEHYS